MSSKKTIETDGLVEVYDNKPIDPVSKDDVILDIANERNVASKVITAWESYVNFIDQQIPLSHTWIEKQTQKAHGRIEATTKVIFDLDQLFFNIQRMPGDEVARDEVSILDECHERLDYMTSRLFKRQLFFKEGTYWEED